MPTHAGVIIHMAGIDWVVPPLSLGQVKRLKAMQDAVKTDLDNLDTMGQAVQMALSRNYPDITLERVENDLLDAGNIKHVFEVVMGVSGMVAAAGEAGGAIP